MATTQRYAAANQDARTLLQSLGIDGYNATLIISHLFIPPATTDMDMAPVLMFVEALQKDLVKLGAPIDPSGEIDLPTAQCFEALCGPDWPSMPWFQIGQSVIHASDSDIRLAPATPPPAMGGLIDLPAIPGGLLGWAAIGAVVYFGFFHKR
jgi:hypothetical protein